MKLNNKQKIKHFKFLKEKYPNIFLNSKVCMTKFDIIVSDFFYQKAYKARGSYKDAMFSFWAFSKFGIVGFCVTSYLTEHQTLRYAKLLIAAKKALEFERYDIVIRVNKILLTYFHKAQYQYK